MKTIRFVKNSGPYCPRDVAGFATDVADAYIDRGDAVDAIEPIEITGDATGDALPEIITDLAAEMQTSRKPRK